MPGYPPYDDSTKLPPITQNGANTFGFILNGKVWRPHGIETTPTTNASYFNGGLSIQANKSFKSPFIFQSMTFHLIVHGIDTGYYLLQNWNHGPGINYSDYASLCEYFTDSVFPAHVHLTRLDTVNRIVSGTFYMKLKPQAATCDTVNITNGRFDIKF